MLLWSDLVGPLEARVGAPGALTLRDPLNNPIDFVRWGGSTVQAAAPDVWLEDEVLLAPNTNGITLARVSDVDSSASGDWCLGRATPATAAADCFEAQSPGAVWINEVSAAVPDYAELVAGSATPVDLIGWTLRWTDGAGASGQMVFPDGALLDNSVTHMTVDDDGTSADTNSALHFANNIEWSANTTGSAWLEDPLGNPVDFVRWGGSLQAPPPGLAWTESAALPLIADGETLSRQGADTDSAADWCVAAPSPRAANMGCL